MIPLPPRAGEQERSLVAAVTFDAELWPMVRDRLTAEDFSDGHARAAWCAAVSLDADGLAVDMPGVASRMAGVATPLAWLMHARDDTPSSARWESWVEAIHRASVARRAASEAQALAKRAAEAAGNPSAVLVEAADRFQHLAAELRGPGSTDAPSAVREMLDAYRIAEERRIAGIPTGIPTGFAELDRLTGGWRRSNLVVIAARPSVGKSALATQLVGAACRAGCYVGMFSLEMTRVEILQRMAAQVSGVPFRALLAGNLMPNDEADFREASNEIAAWAFDVDERAALTTAEISATCSRWQAKRQLGLVVIDYLQLARAAGLPRNANRENEVSEVSRSLKALAKRLDCPVIALAQLNREGEKTGRKPVLSDLRESGQIEQDSDVIAFLHRERRHDGAGYEDETLLALAKQRNGQPGIVHLRYQGDRARFVE